MPRFRAAPGPVVGCVPVVCEDVGVLAHAARSGSESGSSKRFGEGHDSVTRRRRSRRRSSRSSSEGCDSLGRCGSSLILRTLRHKHASFCHVFSRWMRATRLVSLLLLLQLRGQLTAAELAGHFDVSIRTIHRDIEALGAAGVPVEAVRGPAGGYRLSGGYRTKLTGLTADEAEALFVAPAPAAELGLGGVLTNARLKVLSA